MNAYEFNPASSASEIEKIANDFDKLHGDPLYGTIPDKEFDKLYDHLLDILGRHGRIDGDSNHSPWDFSGDRYCDQLSSIGIVPREDLNPMIALTAGLEAVTSSHRPMAIIFDFYPDSLLVCSPNKVFSTFTQGQLGH